jgi:hypothetical protein
MWIRCHADGAKSFAHRRGSGPRAPSYRNLRHYAPTSTKYFPDSASFLLRTTRERPDGAKLRAEIGPDRTSTDPSPMPMDDRGGARPRCTK